MNTTRFHWARLLRDKRGQSLVLMALLMLSLMAMLALALDGGNTYFMRRAAQNAADAGALAGATVLCQTGDDDAAVAAALDYAVDRNRADKANVSVTLGSVGVTASFTFSTIYGSLFGWPEITAPAYAQAGCFLPGSAQNVLPIAWSCEPYIGDDGQARCWVEFGSDELYIIMDSDKVSQDIYCQDPPNSGTPAGALDCDYDDDGYNDVLAGGDRSWLDLNGGGGGANELRTWITDGYPAVIHPHTWLPSQTGSVGSAFRAFEGVLGSDRLVPVYDTFCTGHPESTCPTRWDTGDHVAAVGANQANYFHAVAFSIFHVTCVWHGGNDARMEDGSGGIVSVSNCPGREAAGLNNNGKTKSVKSVEGYFVEGTLWGLGGKLEDGVNAGAYTVFLTH